jgi:hypothetical protein
VKKNLKLKFKRMKKVMFLLSQKTGIEFKLAGIELGKKYEKLGDSHKIESINFDFFSDFLQPNLGIVINF